jgi:hypothetical protein
MSIFRRLFEKTTANSSPTYQQLIKQSMEELRLKTSAHNATWHLDKARWDVDQNAGIIVFTQLDGMSATCPVQIIGTYNTADGTWLWGWNHPSVVPPLQEHARAVKAYGERHHVEKLTTQKVPCSEQEAWEFTALACKLAEAQGVYRGPAGTSRVFMTFGTVTLSKPQSTT